MALFRLAFAGLSPSIAVRSSRAFFIHAQRLIADGAGQKRFRVTLAVAGLIFDLYRVKRNGRVGIADAQQARVAIVNAASERAQNFRQSFEVYQLERFSPFGFGRGIESSDLSHRVAQLNEV